MQVNKWPAGGSNEVDENGPAVFTIQYQNQGDAPAPTVTLTDTLPAGTTYVSDSSGVTPTVGGGEVIWEFGPVEADHNNYEFYVVLEHTGTVGNTLTNMVDIFAEYDPHDDNNHAEAEVHISSGQPDLYVDKNRQSENPVPGGTVLYEINYGNNGPIPSGQTTFTDTLPANTTVVNWYSRNGYDLWTGGVNNGQLVLEAPAIPAYWGDAIMLRLEVAPDVPVILSCTTKWRSTPPMIQILKTICLRRMGQCRRSLLEFTHHKKNRAGGLSYRRLCPIHVGDIQ